jgi:hypothetical protein
MHSQKLTLLFVLAIVLRAVWAAQASAPPMPPGLVLVAKVNGVVKMTANGATTPLKIDDSIPVSALIHTAINASVVLAFSNGTTMSLGEDTDLIVESFLQEPFTLAKAIRLSEMKEEPSPSYTRLLLNKGELVADVKKLKFDRGSPFSVSTPAGAIGVRGTVFRVVFRPTGTGQAFFGLSVVAGNVELAPVIGRPAAPVIAGLMVPSGQEVVFTFPPFGVPSIPTATMPISAAALRQVTAVLAEMVLATQGAVFSRPP